MHLVVVDLIPALLSWEGRDRSEEPEVAPEAAHALGHLFDAFQMIGVADAATTSVFLRRHLEQQELGGYFDTVVTSAEHGPVLTARAIRRIIRTAAPKERGVTVTARDSLAVDLRRSRMAVVLTQHAEFENVVDAVFDIAYGRVTP
jgi:hypothetical protein